MIPQENCPSSIRSCVSLAERLLDEDKTTIPRVDIAKLRAEGFSIEIAEPANESDFHRSKDCWGGRKRDEKINAAIHDLVTEFTWYPPHNASAVIAARHGVDRHKLINTLCYQRKRQCVRGGRAVA